VLEALDRRRDASENPFDFRDGWSRSVNCEIGEEAGTAVLPPRHCGGRQRSAQMLHLTALELAALEEICRQQIDGRRALENQLATS